MENGHAYYHFLPAVRQGFARWIKEDSDNKKRAEIGISIYLKARNKDTGVFESNNGGKKVPVQLYGPGDILGFSPDIVVRTEPHIGTFDFEPNYFPFIEFGNSDFVWRYSPNPVESLQNNTSVKYIRPWLVLVALESGIKNDDDEYKRGETEFARISQNVQGLPDLIKVKTQSLPNLVHNWRWAHVQVNGEEDIDNSRLITLLGNPSDLITSRLMCARRLRPNRKYSCFVLPSTRLGRFAGIDKASLVDISAYDPAWQQDGEDEIEIPFYYTWEFRTGASGDFEHLVRLLERRILTDIGTQSIDCSRPGYNISGIDRPVNTGKNDIHTLDMEGALQSLDTKFTPWGMDPYCEVEESGEIYKVEMVVNDVPGDPAAGHDLAVSWHTSSAGATSIKYGEAALTEEIVSSSRANPHLALLPGINANKEYKFNIEFISANGPVKVAGKFLIPPHSVFQEELARLVNKPVSEDLALEKFEVTIGHYDWITDFRAALLSSGSAVEFICWTLFPSTLEIHYGEAGTEVQNVIEDTAVQFQHVMEVAGLLPGRSYRICIKAKNEEREEFETNEINISMPPLPCVVPPVYGRWHYGKYRVRKVSAVIVDELNQKNWIDELNLDPRHRSAASLGTQVIRKNQEDLMSSAWDQLGAIESVNALLRKKQFGRECSKNVMNRVAQLPMEKFIYATAPFHKRIPIIDNEKKVTIQHYLANNTLLPKAIMDGSFRKINAHMHKKRKVVYEPIKKNVFERYLGGEFIKQENMQPNGTLIMESITEQLALQTQAPASSSENTVPAQGTKSASLLKEIDDQLIAKALRGNPFLPIVKLGSQEGTASAIGEAMTNWLNYEYAPTKQLASEDPKRELEDIKAHIVKELEPENTFKRTARQLLRIDRRLQSRFEAASGDCLDPIMAAPEFPQPMYESLRELSNRAFLPGIEKVKPNTIGMLKTNPRFLESFLCGLNHEFGAELLWRGYPTDQRGTYFRQFWDPGYYVPSRDAKDRLLNEWLDEHYTESVEKLSKDEKVMVLYKHLNLFKKELEAAHLNLLVSSTFQGKEASGLDKERIKGELFRLIKRIEQHYPDALQNISDDVLTAFNPFIEEMILSECIREGKVDIEKMHLWKNRLGKNTKETGEKLVLIIRGELLKRYPNAIIYAVDGVKPCEGNANITIPAIEENIRNYYEYLSGSEALSGEELEEKVIEVLTKHPKIFPVFGAQVLPDINFLGFPFDRYASIITEENPGKYFVIEEHISEPRFGMDLPPESGLPGAIKDNTEWKWDNLSWGHFMKKKELEDNSFYIDNLAAEDTFLSEPEWNAWMNSSSAKRALITYQKPVRIVISANEMLPK